MAGENLKMVLKGKSTIVPPEKENILAARYILKEILGEESQESKKRKKDTRKISGEEKKKIRFSLIYEKDPKETLEVSKNPVTLLRELRQVDPASTTLKSRTPKRILEKGKEYTKEICERKNVEENYDLSLCGSEKPISQSQELFQGDKENQTLSEKRIKRRSERDINDPKETSRLHELIQVDKEI